MPPSNQDLWERELSVPQGAVGGVLFFALTQTKFEFLATSAENFAALRTTDTWQDRTVLLEWDQDARLPAKLRIRIPYEGVTPFLKRAKWIAPAGIDVATATGLWPQQVVVEEGKSTLSPLAVLDKTKEAIEEHQDDTLITKCRWFFYNLEVRTNYLLMDGHVPTEKVAARTTAVSSLKDAFKGRLFELGAHSEYGSAVPSWPGGLQDYRDDIAGVFTEIGTDFGWGGALDLEGLEKCFEHFACGELRIASLDEPTVLGPDGAYFFLFPMFAIHAYETESPDKATWGSILPRWVRAAALYRLSAGDTDHAVPDIGHYPPPEFKRYQPVVDLRVPSLAKRAAIKIDYPVAGNFVDFLAGFSALCYTAFQYDIQED